MIKKLLTLVMLLMAITLLAMTLPACQKAPVLQKDEIYVCFSARDCDYRNPKNPEKCVDQWKECRARERYVFCNQEGNRWERQDAQSCWDKLDSK